MIQIVAFLAILNVALGASSVKIDGGEPIDIDSVPWTVSIQKDYKHVCGGALITPIWVLTSARCVQTYNFDLNIRYGSIYTTKDGYTDPVEAFHIHPEYNPNTHEFDIALIKLAEKVKIPHSRVAVLPGFHQDYPDGADLIISGWGKNPNSDVLEEITLHKINRNTCSSVYGNAISPAMICAGSSNKNFCTPDFGDPAVYYSEIVGIYSWGNGCTDSHAPGVFTRVAEARTWITRITGI